MCTYIYIYIYICTHNMYTNHTYYLLVEDVLELAAGHVARHEEVPLGGTTCLTLRPVRLLRVWVSKGLTQADS